MVPGLSKQDLFFPSCLVLDEKQNMVTLVYLQSSIEPCFLEKNTKSKIFSVLVKILRLCGKTKRRKNKVKGLR